MIVPTKGISPQRSILALGAQIILVLEQPMTVSRVWSQVQQWRRDNDHHSPIPFWWFVLALDLIYALGLVDFRNDLLMKRRADASSS